MDNFLLSCPLQNADGIQLVADLINHNSLDWNYKLMPTLFLPQQVLAILSIPIAPLSIFD